MVSARHAGFLCPLLLALVFGCGGGGKSEQPINPTNPPSQKPPPNPPPARPSGGIGGHVGGGREPGQHASVLHLWRISNLRA